MSKIGNIDVGTMLAEDGLEFIGKTDKGLEVRDVQTGETALLSDVKAYVSDNLSSTNPDLLKQHSLDNFDFTFNDKEQAIANSPVSFIDRLKMGFGNQPGSIKLLKQKFEDASLNSKGEIVVKDGGIWHQVDPSSFGYTDAFELAKDLADVVGDAFPVLGSIAGTAAAAPLVGSTVGAGIGEGVRTSLGRIMGTYEATVEENLMDVGIESILNIAGYGVGAVASKAGKNLFNFASDKPEMLGLRQAAQTLKNAPRETKDMLSKLLSFTTGTSEPLAREVVENGDEVFKIISRKTAEPKSYDDIANELARESVEEFKGMLSKFKPTVFNEYNTLKKELLGSKGIEKFSLNLGDPKKLLLEGGSLNNEAFDGLLNSPVMGQFFKKNASGDHVLKSIKELNKESAFATPEAALFTENMHKQLSQLMNSVSKLGNLGNLKGSLGASKALELKKFVDDFHFNVVKVNRNFKDITAPFTLNMRKAIVSSFDNTPAASLYHRTMDTISTNLDTMAHIDSILESKNVGSKLEKAVSMLGRRKSGDNVTDLDLYQYVAGKTNSEATMKNILTRSAAKEYMTIFPYMRNLAGGPAVVLGTAAGANFASDDPAVTSGAALGAAALISPRIGANVIRGLVKSGAAFKRAGRIPADVANKVLPVALQAKEFIFRANPSQKELMRNNPDVLAEILAPIFTTLDN